MSIDYSNLPDSDWHDWEPGLNVMLKANDVFILGLSAKVFGGIYRVVKDTLVDDPHYRYSIEALTKYGWDPAHDWALANAFIRRHKKKVDKPVLKSSGCICKRCKNFNDYAESNQQDGSFICYSCRH